MYYKETAEYGYREKKKIEIRYNVASVRAVDVSNVF